MNLADSMRSQDNINKVGHSKEKIKEDGEEYDLLHMDWVTYFRSQIRSTNDQKKTEVYKFR